jgi:hypothetical protein
MCRATVAASAAAARASGYKGLAVLIETEQLTPIRIASIMGYSASRTRGKDLALIVLAGACGRWHASPDGWTDAEEKAISVAALAGEIDPAKTLRRLCKEANSIVSEHWPEIARAA